MASTFSPQLRIELIGAGEQAGAWNNTTNTNLGTLIEQAISGVAAIAVNSTSYTLEIANGAADEARSMVLNVTGTPGAAFNVICPTSSKVYIAKNGVATHAMTLKTSAGTGITIPSGRTMLLYCDGVNVVNGVDELPTGSTLNGAVIATLTGVETLTNKTLTAPKFADGGFIADANGNEMVVFDTVATAVNELTISNAATAGSPAIYATGGDTNINVNIVPKGTGVVQATGVEVATVSGTQTLTNKTLTSPEINDATIDGGTIDADSISISGVDLSDIFQVNGELSGQTLSASSYTLVLADAGKIVEVENASANTITVPTNASVAFPINTVVNVVSSGTGQTTIAAPGVTLLSYGAKTKLTGQYSMATLIKKSTDTWWLAGDLIA